MKFLSHSRVLGHEVAGVIDAAGAAVKDWKKGERVGVGWHGGHDGIFPACRRGDFVNCANGKACGVSYDGGYQEYMVAPVEALARMLSGKTEFRVGNQSAWLQIVAAIHALQRTRYHKYLSFLIRPAPAVQFPQRHQPHAPKYFDYLSRAK